MPIEVVDKPITKEKTKGEKKINVSKFITPEQYTLAYIRGIPKNVVKARVNVSDYTIEEAISIPVNKRRKQKKDPFTDEEYKEASKNGVSRLVVRQRYEQGYSKAECLVTNPKESGGVKYAKFRKEKNARIHAEHQVSKLENTIDKLMEALDYYAEKENGEIARKALESIK